MSENVQDQRHYTPRNSMEELAAEWPDWSIWRGVNQLYYARLIKSSPPIVLPRAQDLDELRDMLIGWKWLHRS